jgi:hypothetical protein
MPILPSVVRRVNARRLSQIEHFRKYPVETQEKVLLGIIKSAVQTEWGKKYGFSSVRSVEDFQSRVPVRNYEDYLPFIDRLIKGEKDISWPGEVRWFAKSS